MQMIRELHPLEADRIADNRVRSPALRICTGDHHINHPVINTHYVSVVEKDRNPNLRRPSTVAVRVGSARAHRLPASLSRPSRRHLTCRGRAGETFMESSISCSHEGRALVMKGVEEVEDAEINFKFQDKAKGQRLENFIRPVSDFSSR
ncbi:hypothetical protein BHE74_00059149 [Ensete ventricosum]|nr:hypothetical protein BHE74_00059149 [Ensete ventricosum]